ncbi:CPXV006 protein [Cowpox virus]|nr:CPXV006 protein [Cowpox virus]
MSTITKKYIVLFFFRTSLIMKK